MPNVGINAALDQMLFGARAGEWLPIPRQLLPRREVDHNAEEYHNKAANR
jgi:hypothetical protein